MTNLQNPSLKADLVSSIPQIKKLVVTAALDKLLGEKYFSICTLDSILDTLGLPRNTQAHKMLNALHCCDYSKMDPELVAAIPELIKECLVAPSVRNPVTKSIVDCISFE